jgi:hypothetical protein
MFNMEKVVENWLNENKDWFETYAIENLNLKTVEKWLKLNDKTICKCPPTTLINTKHKNQSNIKTIIVDSTCINHHNNNNEIVNSLESNNNHEDEIINRLHHSHSYTCVIHNKRISNNYRNNYQRNEAFKMLSSTEELSSEDEGKENKNKTNSNQLNNNNFVMGLNPCILNTKNNNNNNNNTSKLSRRNNFFSMRKHHSLNSTNSISNLNLLKYLIETKIKLPTHLNQHFYSNKMKLTTEKINDTEFLLELIKDISYELDLNTINEKIIANIKFLLNADKVSLFFVCHTRKCLASFKFDPFAGSIDTNNINNNTNINSNSSNKTNEQDLTTQFFEMEIPFGQTILGQVAQTGNLINIKQFKQVVIFFFSLLGFKI